MVFQSDERPAIDNLFFLPCMHSRKVNGGVQLDPVAGWGSREVDKDNAHGGEKAIIPFLEKYLGKEIDTLTGIDNPSAVACADDVCTCADHCSGRSDKKHVHFRENESCLIACKRVRHGILCQDQPSCNPDVLEEAPNELPATAHDRFIEDAKHMEVEKTWSTSVENFSVDNKNLQGHCTNLGNQTKSSANGLGLVSDYFCFPHEDSEWEHPMQGPFDARGDKGKCPADDTTSQELSLSFCDRFPRKHVAMGPNHQVNVSSWGPESLAGESDKVLLGGSVISTPDVGSNILPEVGVGGGANCCNCVDVGSIRCTRKHVSEARERSREELGPEKFCELGFHNMGEVVALNWSGEEEQLFHNVVYAHPASMGKNFWNTLPKFFPSRSNKELVSYYFNVFVLRKRTLQNRLDPWNPDSDNDEWDESDVGCTMDDDLTRQDQGVYSQSLEDGELVYVEQEEEEEDEEDDLEEEMDVEGGFQGSDVVDAYIQDELAFSCKSSSVLVEPLQKGSLGNTDSYEAHDDSCTSYEGQHIVDHSLASPNMTEGSNFCSCTLYEGKHGTNLSSHPFTTAPTNVINTRFHSHGEECRSNTGTMCIPGSSDHNKDWEGYYFSSSDKVDFLPTCHVIEEVFGNKTWVDEASER